MQKISHAFERLAAAQAAAHIESLMPAVSNIQHYLKKNDLSASVYVVDREESYPLVYVTPYKETSVEDIKDALDQPDCCYQGMRGIQLPDILAVVDKDGNKPHGVVFNACPDIVICMAKTLSQTCAADPAPAFTQG
jgi:hypothetical protein